MSKPEPKPPCPKCGNPKTVLIQYGYSERDVEWRCGACGHSWE